MYSQRFLFSTSCYTDSEIWSRMKLILPNVSTLNNRTTLIPYSKQYSYLAHLDICRKVYREKSGGTFVFSQTSPFGNVQENDWTSVTALSHNKKQRPHNLQSIIIKSNNHLIQKLAQREQNKAHLNLILLDLYLKAIFSGLVLDCVAKRCYCEHSLLYICMCMFLLTVSLSNYQFCPAHRLYDDMIIEAFRLFFF